MNRPLVYISDANLVAFLHCHGYDDFTPVITKAGRVGFLIPATDELNRLISEFYGKKDLQVNVRNFIHYRSRIKRLIYLIKTEVITSEKH